MAGDPQMYIKVAANIADLKAAMAEARTSVENATEATKAASAGWSSLGQSWVARVAEGVLLRDAIREVIGYVKDMIAYLPELAMKGSAVGDVEEAFQRLSTQAGHLSDTLLTTLRSGTHGTITDFDLMKRANQDMAAGLNLTDEQFGLLSKGAFALAKATGTDVKTALDTMNDAMVTGKAKAIALLTGKIDLKAAEEQFAISLDETADHLTAEGKLEAAREAILKAVGAATERLGEQTDSLDEKVTQGKIAWANFQDELGKTIARSPVLAAGLDSVKASLIEAFGGNQQALVAAIAKKVDDLAILIVDFAIGATATAGALVQVWYGIKTAVLAVETVIVGLVTAIGEVLLKAEQLAGKFHLVPPEEVEAIQRTQEGLRAMTVGLAAQTAEAARGALGQSALGEAIDKTGGMLFQMRDKMAAARDATASASEATTAFVGPLQAAAGAAQDTSTYFAASAAEVKKYTEAWIELNSIGESYADTVATINPALREQIQYYLEAGASVSTLAKAYPELTTVQIDAVEKMRVANEGIAAELTKVYDDYYKVVNAASHDSTQRQIDDAYLTAQARIDAMTKAKTYSVEAEMAIWQAAEQTATNIVQKNLEADIHSKAHFVKLADDARIAYEFATAHADQYTAEWIADLQKTADAAQRAADTFGTAFEDAGAKVKNTITASAADTRAQFENTLVLPVMGDLAELNKALSDFYDQFSLNSAGMAAGTAAGSVGVPTSGPAGQIRVRGLPSRDIGGPVSAGQPYVIGRPEIFVPDRSGSIVPIGGAGGGTSITNHFYITQPLGTPQAIAAAVDDALMGRQRAIGVRD